MRPKAARQAIDLGRTKLMFAGGDQVRVMTTFAWAEGDGEEERGKGLRLKAKVVALEAGEYLLEGLEIAERGSATDGGARALPRRGALVVWKDSANCRMSCGRWASGAAPGDWTTGDILATPGREKNCQALGVQQRRGSTR